MPEEPDTRFRKLNQQRGKAGCCQEGWLLSGRPANAEGLQVEITLVKATQTKMLNSDFVC